MTESSIPTCPSCGAHGSRRHLCCRSLDHPERSMLSVQSSAQAALFWNAGDSIWRLVSHFEGSFRNLERLRRDVLCGRAQKMNSNISCLESWNNCLRNRNQMPKMSLPPELLQKWSHVWKRNVNSNFDLERYNKTVLQAVRFKGKRFHSWNCFLPPEIRNIWHPANAFLGIE